MDWPPKSPLLILMDEESDELGERIKADSLLSEQQLGFNGLVRECLGRSDFLENIRKVKHKSASCSGHLKNGAQRWC
jgi:hypothetical protein